ncbi:hypothetical protein BC827DRAFT_1241224 [Russula dissimulans]|nr:hypothetical protein BC827DRAFT_1241224 [Russula dissimulans]
MTISTAPPVPRGTSVKLKTTLRATDVALDADHAHARVICHDGAGCQCVEREAAYQVHPAHDEVGPDQNHLSTRVSARRRSCRSGWRRKGDPEWRICTIDVIGDDDRMDTSSCKRDWTRIFPAVVHVWVATQESSREERVIIPKASCERMREG